MTTPTNPTDDPAVVPPDQLSEEAAEAVRALLSSNEELSELHEAVAGDPTLDQALDRLAEARGVDDESSAQEVLEMLDAAINGELDIDPTDEQDELLQRLRAAAEVGAKVRSTMDELGLSVVEQEMVEPEVIELDDIAADADGLTLARVMDALEQAGHGRAVRRAVEAKFIIMDISGQRITRVGTDEQGTILLHTDTDVQYPVKA